MSVMTSLDVLKINNSEEIVGVIDECIQSIPELTYFGASPVTRNSYQTLCVTGLPTVGFRNTGSLRTFDSATLGNKTINLKYLDASWTVECAVAEQTDWGKETAIAIQQKAHLKAALQAIAKQTWYGTAADAGGFNGLLGIIEAVQDGNGNKTMVVDANPGQSISDDSCVFAVRTGLDSIQYAWGSEGKLVEGDVVKQLLSGSSVTAGQWVYAQELAGWVGLQVTSKNAAGAITNLSATATKNGLDDDLIYELISKFPAGEGPTALFMNRRSLFQLRASRTATNATGAPAPIPTEVEGIPIYVTDAILNATPAEDSDSGSGS